LPASFDCGLPKLGRVVQDVRCPLDPARSHPYVRPQGRRVI
jgi:hypothetical protein